MSQKDFNHVKKWLTAKLAERGVSTNQFVVEMGEGITNASVFRWYNDTFRPSTEKMMLVCETLSRLPIKEEGRPPRYEKVPLEEGMAQFSIKPRTSRGGRVG